MHHARPIPSLRKPRPSGIACSASCRQAPSCEATRGGDPALLDVRSVVERVGPFSDGDRLVQPGAPHLAAFSVLSGMAKTMHGERVVAFHLPGELFALDVSRTHMHDASVVAIGKTWFCRFPRDATHALCCESEDIARHLNVLRRREHRATNASAFEGDALRRVRGFLADLFRRHRAIEKEDRFLALPMMREDIGNHLGMSAATVTRMLAKLRDSGTLLIRPGGVDILDEAALHAS